MLVLYIYIYIYICTNPYDSTSQRSDCNARSFARSMQALAFNHLCQVLSNSLRIKRSTPLGSSHRPNKKRTKSGLKACSQSVQSSAGTVSLVWRERSRSIQMKSRSNTDFQLVLLSVGTVSPVSRGCRKRRRMRPRNLMTKVRTRLTQSVGVLATAHVTEAAGPNT